MSSGHWHDDRYSVGDYIVFSTYGRLLGRNHIPQFLVAQIADWAFPNWVFTPIYWNAEYDKQNMYPDALSSFHIESPFYTDAIVISKDEADRAANLHKVLYG